MRLNRFEADRGAVSCGDCNRPLGWRIDTEPGTVTIICGADKAKREKEGTSGEGTQSDVGARESD